MILRFLYIDPLKQGLKLLKTIRILAIAIRFLYIDPLKQGLKQREISQKITGTKPFLYIDPLKQGLKQYYCVYFHNLTHCFYT